jgi:Lar family restriction alleviation protein
MPNEPTSALLPCPFCGGAAKVDEVAGEMPKFWPTVRCPDCGARVSACHTEAEAIAAWNTRATPTDPEVAALVERLMKVESSRGYSQGTGGSEISTCWYRNPDGPEAADLITRLSAKLQEADHG